MAKRSSVRTVQRDGPAWIADHPAVRVERMAGHGGSPVVVGLQHVAYPFLGTATKAALQAQLQGIGDDYLDLAGDVAGISADIRAALRENDCADFGWIPLSWGDGEAGFERDPNGSYTVARRTGEGEAIDRTVVLLAGYRLRGHSTGGEVGLRLVMHLSPANASSFDVRVTGLAISNLPAALPRPRLEEVPPALRISLVALRERLSSYYNAEDVSVQGIVPDDPSRIRALRIFGNGRTPAQKVFAFVGELSAGGQIENRASVELLSSVLPKVLASDPQSCTPDATFEPRRPVRSRERLNGFRSKTARLVPLLQQAGRLEVRQTRIGHPDVDNDPDLVQSIDLSRLPLRSDALSAAHAFLRGDEFMRRFDAYGLPVTDYFKMAKLPLVLRHRAPIEGAPDGGTVNAQVRPDNLGADLPELPGPKPGADPRPQLEVSFAAANLRRRGLVEVTPKRWRLQPTGLAADRRWAWHEFCHVLNYASFGKLEFRFAHSAGDALAAIVADPDSPLARRPSPFARHITFPWVSMGRRHDRDPARGWGCCGRRNIARLASSTAFDDQRRGYFEEQLLSSALFRFYRAIGGDCAAGNDRRAASDYAVYLIMRGIQMLGQTTTPTRTIEGFVNELMQADTATGIWDVTAPWPESLPARSLHRVGGCVHKVVRWAFERQGLYATDDPVATVEGVGKPPAVDIFIANSRPGDNGTPPPEDGGYWPVPLQWSPTPQPWHASDNGIKLLLTGQLVITVRNRGTQTATGVIVVCWLWPVGSSPPPTYSPPWPATASPAQDVPAGAAVDFEFDPGVPLTGTTRCFVFAAATCDGDRANIDTASGQPCATLGAPLLDLVANDNNLGLRILTL